MDWPKAVRIREVGPRDGIQSERARVATHDKIRLIDALSRTGLRYIETVSFVSPKAIPQMADAQEVWRGIERNPDVFYSALVPNRKGAEIAAECGVDGMQVFIAATDSYNLKNVRRTVKDSLANVRDVVAVAARKGIPVEGTISTAFGCPYEGDVSPERVVEVTRWMVDCGVTTISYGDTTGMGTPRRVREVVDALRRETPEVTANMHFHDTRGTGLANVLAALEYGVDYFDSSVGGMGGSPYAEGATGNIATEDLVHMLIDMDISTGVDLAALMEAGRLAQSLVQGELPSKVLKAGPRWSVAGSVASPEGA
ncbi:MAG TPA: hydroxymethylglutaryl-CoA lyase [Actinomycetota bacterium]|jgi:hydroxymethylglutaryl-CoA lyase|nr:hydroxymethylglutaryl-CoA lyase [Actinomycetota bacterium]